MKFYYFKFMADNLYNKIVKAVIESNFFSFIQLSLFKLQHYHSNIGNSLKI
jgi:hypothetical protein